MKSRMKISPIVLTAVLVFTMFVAPAVADRTVIGDTISSTAPPGYGNQVASTQYYEYIGPWGLPAQSGTNAPKIGSSWVGNMDGTMTLKVDVAITTGIAGDYGEGQYVNAWVDWDDSGTFDGGEQVMDQKKMSVNAQPNPYSGTLQYTATFTCVNTGTHWTRVNHGYGVDPPSGAGSWTYGDIEDAKISFATCIPEFSTIALPIASILGLLFFFNYRKRKREQ